MLKATALGLVLINALFLAWTQGWLGGLAPQPPSIAGREPQRMGQQVRPESVQVLRPRDVSAALARQASGAVGHADKPSNGAAEAPRSR
jgi:hypothetical protein